MTQLVHADAPRREYAPAKHAVQPRVDVDNAEEDLPATQLVQLEATAAE